MLFTVPGLIDVEEDPIVEPDAVMADDGCAGRFAKAFMKDEVPWMDLRNEVLDMMLLAVPELCVDADDAVFEDIQIPYDGMESCWAEPQDAPIPEHPSVSVGVAMLASPAEQAMLAAPALPHLIEAPSDLPVAEEPEQVPETVPEPCVQIPSEDGDAAVEYAPIPSEMQDVASADAAVCEPQPVHTDVACEEITVISPAEDWTESFQTEAEATITENDPAVRFSFGPQEVPRGGWRVCFSF